MGGLLSRFTVIENNSEVPVELRECPKGDPHGTSCPVIVLAPNKRKIMAATKYYVNCIDAGIPRAIKFYSDGVCFETLSPQDFIANIQLKVTINHEGQLVVTRVRATTQDIFRIKALVCFLGHITGRTEEPL